IWEKSKNAASAINFGTRNLSIAFVPIFGFIFRVAMLFIFFYYLVEFVCQLWHSHRGLAVIIGASAVFLLIAFLVMVTRAARAFNPHTQPGPTGLLPFVLINLLPITLLAFATWWKGPDFQFENELLKFTQDFLRKINKVLRQ